MGLIATRDKRDKLRLFYDAASKAALPLQGVLMAGLQAADDSAPNGAWVSSTSEAGGSVAFSVLQGMSPLAARRLCGELLDLYDKVVAYLPSGSTDAAIYAQMIGGSTVTGPTLFRRGGSLADWTGIRYGAGINLASQ